MRTSPHPATAASNLPPAEIGRKTREFRDRGDAFSLADYRKSGVNVEYAIYGVPLMRCFPQLIGSDWPNNRQRYYAAQRSAASNSRCWGDQRWKREACQA